MKSKKYFNGCCRNLSWFEHGYLKCKCYREGHSVSRWSPEHDEKAPAAIPKVDFCFGWSAQEMLLRKSRCVLLLDRPLFPQNDAICLQQAPGRCQHPLCDDNKSARADCADAASLSETICIVIVGGYYEKERVQRERLVRADQSLWCPWKKDRREPSRFLRRYEPLWQCRIRLCCFRYSRCIRPHFPMGVSPPAELGRECNSLHNWHMRFPYCLPPVLV